ncbi:hypothetical protein ES332_A05G301400v1 [Gossypium tomentosum]|uniref:Endonuclease/exonuclease/phosphatase domain-containing protein n=1 Tax=Gossypium tomentosum TaxID=34277 RepID=A0A5D2QPN1_GOSTO|nr:hypothetical protein ES332_A05G301400v1 [Gossypium tomentosum]
MDFRGDWLLRTANRRAALETLRWRHKIFIYTLITQVFALEDKLRFFFTTMYGIPNGLRRRLLWERLSCAAHQSTIVWIVLGDFNALLHENETQGGSGS